MRTGTWVKSLLGFSVIMIGGPMLIDYVTPTEEELFKRYNPDLQRRSLEQRDQKLREANEFIDKIKEYSKSDKHIWDVWKEADIEDKKRKRAAEKLARDQKRTIADEIRRQRMEEDSKSQ